MFHFRRALTGRAQEPPKSDTADLALRLKIGTFSSGNHWKIWKFSILLFWNKFPEKTKTFSKKLECIFLVGNTKIKTAKLPHIIVLPEADNKTNKIEGSGWETSWFWKICFRSVTTSYKELIWCTNYPVVHSFCKGWRFIWVLFLWECP